MKLSQFDLNLLRALDALLTEKHVTRAATQLFVTQQAASSALQRLREHFEDQLLVRHGRQLELTPLGSALVEPVRNALLAAQAALDARPTFDPLCATGVIRIAMSDYGQFVVMPALMRHITARAPRLHCQVLPLPLNGCDPLEMGDLDLMLSSLEHKLYGEHPPSSMIRSQKVFTDDFVCVADAKCVDLSSGLSTSDYRQARHNNVFMGRSIKSLVEGAWTSQGLNLNVVAIAPSFSAQLFMLPGTPIIATVQRKLAKSLAPHLSLEVSDCPFWLPELDEHLMWHARSNEAPAVKWIRSVFEDIAQELSPHTYPPH